MAMTKELKSGHFSLASSYTSLPPSLPHRTRSFSGSAAASTTSTPDAARMAFVKSLGRWRTCGVLSGAPSSRGGCRR